MVLSKESKLHGILFYFTADGKYILPKYTSICSSKVVSATKRTSDNDFVLFISLIAMPMSGPIIIQISET
jgi:hypothetical protein